MLIFTTTIFTIRLLSLYRDFIPIFCLKLKIGILAPYGWNTYPVCGASIPIGGLSIFFKY